MDYINLTADQIEAWADALERERVWEMEHADLLKRVQKRKALYVAAGCVLFVLFMVFVIYH